jgi:hypothetical protein
MRGRAVLAALVLIAGAVLAIVLFTSTSADDDASTGTILTWEEPPLAITPPDLPNDRVAYGTVRNTSVEGLKAATKDFEVRDAGGETLEASVQFLGSYAHGIYGAFQKPHPLPPEELSRLGYRVALRSGQTAPLTVSYRLGPDSELPATLFYRGSPALELPDEG